jgi:NAD(P)-dependent dehydrogenase (short-subunit alcohol dehydrogenase family)
LGGLFLTSQQFAKHFQQQGHGNIINIASVYGVIAPKFEIYANTTMTMPVEYAAIKSGVIHLTVYMAKLFKSQQIRVNCISPGGILDKQPSSFLNAYKANSLNKGMLDASDLTGTLVFLLSENSQYINGQNIVVDDGFIL